MNKNSLLELATIVANKTTFLQVARAATKGNVVQKNMVVEGKKAVKFFDKAPDFLQEFVESINPKKLSVRYGVKGYEGSSVTGFHIFDGDTVVAKGALGLDKTYGKEPFVQFNMKLTPKAGEASLGFKYNGNSIFGPNMSASQTLKSGKYNTHMEYGDTMRLDYVETEGFSEYMRACGVDYHFDKMEIVSAREIAENQVNSNKRMREMVGGRHVYSKEERLKLEAEKARIKEQKTLRREKYKDEVAQLEEDYKKEIAEIKECYSTTTIDAEIVNLNSELTSLAKDKKEVTEAAKRYSESVSKNQEKLQVMEQELRQMEQKSGSIKNEGYTDAEVAIRMKIGNLAKETGSYNLAFSKLSASEFEVYITDSSQRLDYITLKNKIATLESDVQQLKWNIHYQNASIQSIETELASIEGKIAKLKNSLKSLKEKRAARRKDAAFELRDARNRFRERKTFTKKSFDIGNKKNFKRKNFAQKIIKDYKGMSEQEIETKLKAIEKLDQNAMVDKAYLRELIAKEEILPYFNDSTVKKIKELNCPKEEWAEKLTKIFMEEMGYNPELVPIHKETLDGLYSNVGASFQSLNGSIQVENSLAESKEILACVLRHELDHFDLFARLAKTIGLEKFYEVLSKGNGYTKASINKKFWEAAIVDAKPLTKREAGRYMDAIKKYHLVDDFDGFEKKLLYHTSDIESRAHDIQASLAQSLGVDTKDIVYQTFAESRCCRKMSKELDRILGKDGTQTERDELILSIMLDEYMKADIKKFNIFKIYDNVLERLKRM